MITVLFPVFLLIGLGYLVARLRVVDQAGVKALSDLAFAVFLPALLFRSMARTDFSAFPLVAPLAYFSTSLLIFGISYRVIRRRGLQVRHAAIFGLAGVFANTVMVGIPLVRIAYGEAGLAVLLSVIALHAMVLMTTATVVIESGSGVQSASRMRTIAGALRLAVKHPIIRPILAGAAFSVVGLKLPAPIDTTLSLLGSVAPTLCLMLLGASLSGFDPRAQFATALRLSVMKSLVHPLAVYLVSRWVFRVDPLTVAVLTVAASLPIGANIYLLAQRYKVGLETVSAGATLSTVATALTIGPLLAMLPH